MTASKLHAARDHDRRRGRPARRGGAGLDARPGVGPAPARARPQPRSAAGAGRPPPGLDRLAARARPRAEVARGDRRRPGRRWSTASPAGCGPRGRVGRTVVLRLRFDDFSRATRSHTLASRPPPHTHTILATARALLAAADAADRAPGAHARRHRRRQPRRRRRRPARAAVRPAQRQLPSTPPLDDVRDRFGSAAVTRAVLLGRDQGLSVPMLPD